MISTGTTDSWAERPCTREPITFKSSSPVTSSAAAGSSAATGSASSASWALTGPPPHRATRLTRPSAPPYCHHRNCLMSIPPYALCFCQLELESGPQIVEPTVKTVGWSSPTRKQVCHHLRFFLITILPSGLSFPQLPIGWRGGKARAARALLAFLLSSHVYNTIPLGRPPIPNLW